MQTQRNEAIGLKVGVASRIASSRGPRGEDVRIVLTHPERLLGKIDGLATVYLRRFGPARQ
jgi:hypothetical protein